MANMANMANNVPLQYKEFDFATDIGNNPCMYDIENDNYYSRDTRAEIFRRVGAQHGMSGELNKFIIYICNKQIEIMNII